MPKEKAENAEEAGKGREKAGTAETCGWESYVGA